MIFYDGIYMNATIEDYSRKESLRRAYGIETQIEVKIMKLNSEVRVDYIIA
jgi:hypothetical protein